MPDYGIVRVVEIEIDTSVVGIHYDFNRIAQVIYLPIFRIGMRGYRVHVGGRVCVLNPVEFFRGDHHVRFGVKNQIGRQGPDTFGQRAPKEYPGVRSHLGCEKNVLVLEKIRKNNRLRRESSGTPPFPL